MRRIPRHEWMEWLDGLDMSEAVVIVSHDGIGGDDRDWRLCSADFDPFENVIEIVLADSERRVRMLVEAPTEILAAGPDRDPSHIKILASDGALVLKRSWDSPVAKHLLLTTASRHGD